MRNIGRGMIKNEGMILIKKGAGRERYCKTFG